MSKAFTKEDDAGEALVVPRAPLPAGVLNYVTPRGLSALRVELRELEQRRGALSADDAANRVAREALAEQLRALEARIASAVLVEPSVQSHDEVRFGANVEVENAAGEVRSYRIVGVDEADAAARRIAFTAPLARALLGKSVGDEVEVRTPRGSEALTILAVTYGDPELPEK